MGAATIVGRGVERATLDALLRRARSGERVGAIVVGEAGIGKSTLIGWALDRAVADGGLVVLEGAGRPLTFERALFPFLEAVGQGADTTGERRLIEAGLGDPAQVLAQRIVDELDRRATDRPVLVVLEDLHWADRATLMLVHHLLVRGSGSVSVVATARLHRMTDRDTALLDLVSSVPGSVVELGPLADDEVGSLAATRIGRPPGPGLAALLGEADGNPLLVGAMLDGLLETGGILIGAATADVAGEVQPSPNEELERRILALPPDTRHIVQAAAVLAPYVRVDATAELVGCRSMDVVAAFERASVAGVMVTEPEPAFRHDLYRAAALAVLPPTAREALHLDAARVLTGLGAPGLVIAEHHARGARPGNREAIRQLTEAAAGVVGVDPAVALRLTDVALRIGSGSADLDLRCTRVRALAGCGSAAEAELLARALLREPLVADVEAALRRDVALAAFVDGRPGDAAAAMRRVLELAADDVAAARAHAELAFALLVALQRDEARTEAVAAAAAGERFGDVVAWTAALSVQCWLDLWAFDLPAAAMHGRRIIELTDRRAVGEWLVHQPHLVAAAALFESGSPDEAEVVIGVGRSLVAEAGLAWATPVYDAMSATMAMRAGRLDDVVRWSTQALDGTQLVDGLGVEVWSRALLARVALCRCRTAEAEEHLAAAELSVAEGRAQFGLDHLVLARSALAEQVGDRESAHRHLTEGWDLFTAIGILNSRQPLVGALARSCVLSGDPERLAGLVPTTPSTAQGHPAAEADRCRVELWATPTVATAEAALEQVRRAGRPLDELGVLLDLVELGAVHPGLRDLASSAFRAAGTWLADHDAATDGRSRAGAGGGHRRTVRPRRPRFGLDALTDAEARVAGLVAEGFTNVEIAGRLLVSRRTVDTHVLAAYRKLGVRSRVELTRAVLGAPRRP